MQSVPITTKVLSSNPANGEVYLIQHYVIKFVSDKAKKKYMCVYCRMSKKSRAICSIFSNSGHVGWCTASPDTILKLDTLVMIQTKFGFHWSSTFRAQNSDNHF
jgi:hypothetical protein